MLKKDEKEFIFKNIFSSYNKKVVNESYGNFFYGLVTMMDPKLIVELGTCKGYSSIHMGLGLKECDSGGVIECYDLWDADDKKTNFHDEQKGMHLTSNVEEFKQTLDKLNLNDYVSCHTKEAFSVLKDYEENSVDIIHIDIGNCGEVLQKVIEDVKFCLKPEGILIFEGGADYRDQVGWMKKYNKKKIKKVLETDETVKESFEKLTFSVYPSVTLLKLRSQYE